MKQKQIARGILGYLDPVKRKRALLRMIVLLVVFFAALSWANQWDSPLAVMPRVFCAISIGYLLVHIQSVRMYPRIERYFDKEALRKDAEGDVSPMPPPLRPGVGEDTSPM